MAPQLPVHLDGPAAEPPAGVTSNFQDPSNLNATIISVLSICLILTTSVVLLRVYTKLFLIRSTGYEDYTIVLAWVGLLGFTIPSVFILRFGGGVHLWDVRLRNYQTLLYWIYINAIVYNIIVYLIKVSILLQYLRIFVPNRKSNLPLFIAIHSLVWVITIFYLFATFFAIFECSPREKIWITEMDGKCFNQNEAYQSSGLFNVISDFVILVLPWASIWKLKLPLKKKLLIIAMFATGVFACAASILRTYYTYRIAQSPDASYDIIIMGLWLWAEMTTGIIVSCLPVMPRFFQYFGPKLFGILSFGSRFSLDQRKPEPTDIKVKTGISVQFSRPSGKDGSGSSETWCGPTYPRTQYRGDYISLDEYDVSKRNPICERIYAPAAVHATRRHGLEFDHFAP